MILTAFLKNRESTLNRITSWKYFLYHNKFSCQFLPIVLPSFTQSFEVLWSKHKACIDNLSVWYQLCLDKFNLILVGIYVLDNCQFLLGSLNFFPLSLLLVQCLKYEGLFSPSSSFHLSSFFLRMVSVSRPGQTNLPVSALEALRAMFQRRTLVT